MALVSNSRDHWSAESIEDFSFTVDDVFEGLCKLNPSKTSGIPGLLIEGAPLLADPLARLFVVGVRITSSKLEASKCHPTLLKITCVRM